jgi:hypothetical protein
MANQERSAQKEKSQGGRRQRQRGSTTRGFSSVKSLFSQGNLKQGMRRIAEEAWVAAEPEIDNAWGEIRQGLDEAMDDVRQGIDRALICVFRGLDLAKSSVVKGSSPSGQERRETETQ